MVITPARPGTLEKTWASEAVIHSRTSGCEVHKAAYSSSCTPATSSGLNGSHDAFISNLATDVLWQHFGKKA